MKTPSIATPGLVLTVLLVGLGAGGARAEDPFVYQAVVGGSARLYPVGASAHGTVYAGTLLWGEKRDANPFYGYARASLRAQTSGTVNGGTARVDVFPVAFAGLSAGFNPAHRLANFGDVDCVSVKCKGWIRRYWVQGSGVLGVGQAFMSWSVRYTQARASSGATRFYDEDSSLEAQAGSDRFLTMELAPGWAITPSNRAGIYYSREIMRGTDQNNEAWQVFYSYKFDEHQQIGAGAGIYRSTIAEESFTAFLTYSYGWGQSLALF